MPVVNLLYHMRTTYTNGQRHLHIGRELDARTIRQLCSTHCGITLHPHPTAASAGTRPCSVGNPPDLGLLICGRDKRKADTYWLVLVLRLPHGNGVALRDGTKTCPTSKYQFISKLAKGRKTQIQSTFETKQRISGPGVEGYERFFRPCRHAVCGSQRSCNDLG